MKKKNQEESKGIGTMTRRKIVDGRLNRSIQQTTLVSSIFRVATPFVLTCRRYIRRSTCVRNSISLDVIVQTRVTVAGAFIPHLTNYLRNQKIFWKPGSVTVVPCYGKVSLTIALSIPSSIRIVYTLHHCMTLSSWVTTKYEALLTILLKLFVLEWYCLFTNLS